MNTIECIISVNKDIVDSIKDSFAGIPHVFTMKFYKTHATGLITLALIFATIAGGVGSLILGLYVADWYFPDNHTVYMWLPIGFIWTFWLIAMYVYCGLLHHRGDVAGFILSDARSSTLKRSAPSIA